MKNSLCIIVFILVSHLGVFAQAEINAYKYIIIPSKFEFLSSEDQYQINSLTKFLFNKYGYTAFLQNETLPEDLEGNPCLALKANVNEVKGGFLKTKMQIKLLDCNEKVIAESRVGETREKEYSKAYNLVVREAFETFQNFEYTYNPELNSVKDTSKMARPMVSEAEKVKAHKEIERLRQENEALKEAQKKEKGASLEEAEEVETKVMPSDVSIPEKKTTPNTENILYAQPINNGFQVVDTKPKKVMFLITSGLKDTFIVKGKDAMVYKKDGVWMLEDHIGSETIVQEINLKF